MSLVNRVPIVDRNFRERVAALGTHYSSVQRRPQDRLFEGCSLTLAGAVELLECQITSRWLDIVARELKARDQSYYTIGSSGHEGNAMLGQLTEVTDMAFLHYRSGGFYLARSRKVPGETPIFDTCLGLTASREDPTSGGRHKIWGSRRLNIPPQTSTIASHLPKAVGAAFFHERMKALKHPLALPEDAIIVCSFGDASASHSTAMGAINAAAWASFQQIPVPILLVCEDNRIGISVHTPSDWIYSNFSSRAGMLYVEADGLDLRRGYPFVEEAVRLCRLRRRPVFLHLKVVRLLGHAGSDVELLYHDRRDLEEAEARDPLIQTAQCLMEAGALSPQQILAMYDRIAAQVRAAGDEAASRPRHDRADDVTAPLNLSLSQVAVQPLALDTEARRDFWKGQPPEEQKPRHMAQLINWGLYDLMLCDPGIVVFGEDVAKKGGVYHVTSGLADSFRLGRVFNTLLDEQTILGLAIGAGHLGLLPIPEIQYLAYLYNAVDQLRGEAGSLQFFSRGLYRNPMVVRVAAFAYQKGFGGHFHNDNGFASLREIPGIMIVTAATGPDAVRLMRTCLQLGRQTGAVVVFLEPIALYMTRDLLQEGDYLFQYPGPDETMPFGEVGRYGSPDAPILVISYANGTYLSRQAAADLSQQGLEVKIMDLRFLKPLNREAIVQAAGKSRLVVIVDEGRRTGSLSEEITTLLVEALQPAAPRIARVCGDDTYIPLGTAWSLVLPSRESIARTIREEWEQI